VQGNLDPAVLLAEPDVIRNAVDELLRSVDGRPGHIFNLGHGVFKETPVEHAIALVEAVKDLSQRPTED
jgi:uroporphyrinogen decarboxylase